VSNDTVKLGGSIGGKSIAEVDSSPLRKSVGGGIPIFTATERLQLRPPFVIRVSDLTVLDTVSVHVLMKNLLSVNVACGAWGSATEVCAHPGSYAQYINLNWKINVMEGSFFRINVWSRGVSIGSSSLSLKELLDMPTDAEGKTEIFAKVVNEKKEITGKVKLACRYEPYVKEVSSKKPTVGIAQVPSSAHSVASNSTPQSPFDKVLPATAVVLSPEKYSQKTSSPLKENKELRREEGNTAVNTTMDREQKNRSPSMERGRPQLKYQPPSNQFNKLSFPVLAIVKSISVFDLISVHMMTRNAPQVLLKV